MKSLAAPLIIIITEVTTRLGWSHLDDSRKTCQMTFNLNFKKKYHSFLIINKRVGARAARKGSEVNFWLKQTN